MQKQTFHKDSDDFEVEQIIRLLFVRGTEFY